MVIKLSKLEKTIKKAEAFPPVDILELEAPPTHPGEILREEFLKPLNLTPQELAKELKIPIETIDELIKEKRPMSPEIAIKLSKRFGTTPQFWMGFQVDYDLWKAAKEMKIANVG
ncbi:addiction module antidote protein, HigA family [Desulfurobacterium pacificum]|uniref:Addiction module antidote protein, HigA family n=1 Tax=Desulfurobacterium pacificum TaxID=240166 RepID=A0ABY1NCB9_9BACT|nr:HigA family addiction module antitoxin [Desulfurobacterium pacificum]SMP06325.1 addiction module antidote protein, HigA family [Desulfurobacterium pacificum]